jgi:hypothetical protein
MPLLPVLRTGAFIVAALVASQGIALSQTDQTDVKNAKEVRESTGLPPRATPGDYQAQGKTGKVTIGAEFTGHSVPTPEGPLSTEDFVVVEVGLFGAAGSSAQLSPDDFSLRINGKKAQPSLSPLMVLKSLKDPSWIPPDTGADKSSKTSFGGGGQGGNDPPPAPAKMPVKMQLANEKRTQKAALPQGERPLPQAGLLFFQYGGKVKSAELIYNGPTGKVSIPLQAF